MPREVPVWLLPLVLIGHGGTMITETIYRKQIRPVLVQGADVMDLIFPTENHDV
jgi:hypothetical protein